MARGGKLTVAQQLFVVQELARFRTPSEVAASVKDLFGVEISRQAAHGYNPERNPRILKRWKDVFAAERERFILEAEAHAVAHQSFRLQEIERIYRGAKSPALQLQALEQAAKERGGAFTNRHDVFDWRAWDASTATPDQLQRIAAGEDPRKVLAGR
jgi:hypothetical protein